MYKLKYKTEFCASHKLDLPYKSKCKNYHGHTYFLELTLKSFVLDKVGMVVDFTKIKKI